MVVVMDTAPSPSPISLSRCRSSSYTCSGVASLGVASSFQEVETISTSAPLYRGEKGDGGGGDGGGGVDGGEGGGGGGDGGGV